MKKLIGCEVTMKVQSIYNYKKNCIVPFVDNNEFVIIDIKFGRDKVEI